MPHIEKATAEIVADMILDLPEFVRKESSEEINFRTADKDPLILIARSSDALAGFLVSYQISEDVYYNWIIGVLPKHRRLGLSRVLMDAFEIHAKYNGYLTCRVKTMNRYRAMLHLLVSRNYDITEFQDDKIVFEKPVINKAM